MSATAATQVPSAPRRSAAARQVAPPARTPQAPLTSAAVPGAPRTWLTLPYSERTVAVDKDAAGALVGHKHQVGLARDAGGAGAAAQRGALPRQQAERGAQARRRARLRQQRLPAGHLQRQAARQPVAERQRITAELAYLRAGPRQLSAQTPAPARGPEAARRGLTVLTRTLAGTRAAHTLGDGPPASVEIGSLPQAAHMALGSTRARGAAA